MKNIYIVLTLIFLSVNQFSFAQETVSLGPGYALESFYSLANGEVKTSPYNNWDLAFQISGFAASIRVNTAKGLTLKKVPNTDASAWATLDTTGYASWPVQYDSDESWDKGAFNLGIEPGNDFDLGWGVYNPVTHHVTGDSVYVLTFADGSVKKLKINSLISGVYSFTYANVDGSSEITSSLNKADFTDKAFGYYAFDGDSTLDREPVSTDYDLRFTRYLGLIAPGTYYPVTGVLSNSGVEIAGLQSVDVNAVGIADTTGLAFSASISEIGYDWKSFNPSTNAWTLADSLVYFVKAVDGEIYKVVFTGFGGSGNGNFIFTKTNLTTSVDPQKDMFKRLSVFPNPARDRFTVLFELKNSDLLNIELSDLTGKTIFQTPKQRYSGLQQLEFNVQGLSAGLYLLRMNAGSGITTQKLVIR
ncbi:MAG: T9SS type A sorting domain-containing protein [Bacteroidia bacterium]